MAPADDGGRELGADLQVDEAAAPRETQRPPLHLPPQVREGAQIKLQLDLPCLKRIKVHVHFSERCQRKQKKGFLRPHPIVELDLLAYLLPLHHQMLQFASDLDIHVQFTVIIPGIYLTVKQLLYFYRFKSASKALYNACICFHLQLQKRTNMCSVRYQCA